VAFVWVACALTVCNLRLRRAEKQKGWGGVKRGARIGAMLRRSGDVTDEATQGELERRAVDIALRSLGGSRGFALADGTAKDFGKRGHHTMRPCGRLASR